jgi:hypothetical protein
MIGAHRLRRHPIPMTAYLRDSLVLAYALPAGALVPLLPPGLEPDRYGPHGFVAIALVKTERLRPSGLPGALGGDHLLVGYRVFVRRRRAGERARRGLHILRTDTDRRSMRLGGNLLTRYNFHLAEVRWLRAPGRLEVTVRTPAREADLHVVAKLADRPAPLPPGSPFAGVADARRFAGPLPWTFDYEPETGSIVMVHGRRHGWDPRSVAVSVEECGFLERPPFAAARPVLANAFHVAGVDYRWARGVLVPATAGPAQPHTGNLNG